MMRSGFEQAYKISRIMRPISRGKQQTMKRVLMMSRSEDYKPTRHTPHSRSYAVKPFASITDCAHAVTIEPSSAFFLSYSRA